MPLSGGTAGAHDDAMHQGSAKRDVANGIAGLGSTGGILALGHSISLTRNVSTNIEVKERTSGEGILYYQRVGATDYRGFISVGGVYYAIQDGSMKDAVSGIPSLDASGHLLIPSYRIYAARGASGQVTFRERTSDERMMRLIRNGADDYEGRINMAGTEQRILTMRDLCVEEYSNHLGAVDNFTEIFESFGATATTDATNHRMDLDSNLTNGGTSYYRSKKTYTAAAKPVITNFLLQNIINGAGDTRNSGVGLIETMTAAPANHHAMFEFASDGSWSVSSRDGVASESTGITALSNGDIISIILTSASVLFYVNGSLVATHTTRIPSAALFVGGYVRNTAGSVSTARETSIDMMSIKKFA